MKFTAGQIAAMVHGKVEGSADTTVSTIAKIEEGKEGSLVFLANPKYEHFLTETEASIILLNETINVPNTVTATLIRVSDPYAAFAHLLEASESMAAGPRKVGRGEFSVISPTAIVGKNVYIGAFCYLGQNVVVGNNAQIYPGVYLGDNAYVGADTILHPGVKVYRDCKIGNKVIIHAGSVIGADGFGFAPQKDGTFKKVPQLGHVVIEDDVEIGANTTIDRATMGATTISKNVKIDNLIQIAHNVVIGENSAIAAQAGISGSTKIGKNCIVGGQAGLVGHLQIADGTRINAQSGVTKSVIKTKTDLSGSPAFEYNAALRSQVIFKRLPELYQRIQELEKEIKRLTQNEKNAKAEEN